MLSARLVTQAFWSSYFSLWLSDPCGECTRFASSCVSSAMLVQVSHHDAFSCRTPLLHAIEKQQLFTFAIVEGSSELTSVCES